MKTIIEEIIDWQTNELIAGRNPKEIQLDSSQRYLLKEYCESILTVHCDSYGERRINDPLPYSDDMTILGMKVVPV